jgi:hypothetical protein
MIILIKYWLMTNPINAIMILILTLLCALDIVLILNYLLKRHK